uniref:Uncharacterized protein n=1 Tax=Vitis vinifera TaxID=29760 RepID=A5BX29_VITVI|nr:hypothetical protein VITISV_003683 [Vitis vinifera]
MARTRGAKSSSPSSRKRVPREEPVPDPTSEPPRPKVVSPPAKPAPQKPSARRYLTRSGGRPLQKRARVESSKPIDLTEQSPVPSPEPSPAPSQVPSPAPPAQPQELQPPLSEPQIPSGVAPEVIIRRPMLTQPPIEGNLDCRTRPFHSELCFDTATFQLRPELADSFRLLRRYHLEQLLAPRDFFYPRVAMDFYQSMTTNQVRDPTLIHFTIDGRHGILGARHIAEALHIPYEPTHFEDFRVWTSPTELEMVHTLSRGASTRPHLLRGELPLSMFLIDAFLRHNIYPLQHWTQRRGVLLEALFKISEGYFFGPHHLIMATLLYFEEKILEHLGYPSDPQLERKRIYREVFTLDKWNNMTAYRVDQPGRPQPAEIPAARRASPRHIPEAEPRMAIPISEYRELCRSLHLRAALLRRWQPLEHARSRCSPLRPILRQIHHHLGIISPPKHSIPIPPKPSQAPPFVHQTMPPEEPTTGEAEAVEPSSPHHPPATI